ncbi:SDR family oxidoreductase [Bacillus sp. JJ1562]|uniref:SDR family oxidoreductase n=1 Tax=Bacillus sp. JJ1562 TaxID=3122960 RepID=UPI0030029632
MEKKVVVITGAGSGLGASLAKKYSNQGAHVCLIGRNQEKLERTASFLQNEYSIYQLDVTVKRDVEEVFQAIYKEVGLIDLLINNAGLGIFDLAERLDEKSVHDMIDINLKGTIFCSQEVLPQMKAINKGIIANIVSTAGLEGKVNESVYCASKFGVRGFTESLFVELQDTSVQIYAAYMGGMKTEFWDGIYKEEEMNHMMEADDIADIIIDNLKPRKNLSVPQVVIKNKL